jgi:Flp pilus assembly protein TadG
MRRLHALPFGMPVRGLRALTRDRDASAAVEFSLVLPLLLAFIFGIIEVGHLLWTVGALNMAVEDAARCVSVSNASTSKTPCPDQTTMQAYAAARTWGMTIPASDFTLTTPACGYQVTVTYPYTPIVGYIPLSMTLSATACYPVWQ